MNPTEKVAVALEYQQWRIVLQMLHEVAFPFKFSGPIIVNLTTQLAAIEATPEAEPQQSE